LAKRITLAIQQKYQDLVFENEKKIPLLEEKKSTGFSGFLKIATGFGVYESATTFGMMLGTESISVVLGTTLLSGGIGLVIGGVVGLAVVGFSKIISFQPFWSYEEAKNNAMDALVGLCKSHCYQIQKSIHFELLKFRNSIIEKRRKENARLYQENLKAEKNSSLELELLQHLSNLED